MAPFPAAFGATSACWLSGIVLSDDCPWTVGGLAAALERAGVQARPFWRPMHLQPPYRNAPRAPLPVTDALWGRVLTLPCSTSLTPGDQARVIETLRALLDAPPAPT